MRWFVLYALASVIGCGGIMSTPKQFIDGIKDGAKSDAGCGNGVAPHA